MEALKATIEKLKINYDTAQQKWKLDTNRYVDVLKLPMIVIDDDHDDVQVT